LVIRQLQTKQKPDLHPLTIARFLLPQDDIICDNLYI
jgi:hypothetical protein